MVHDACKTTCFRSSAHYTPFAYICGRRSCSPASDHHAHCLSHQCGRIIHIQLDDVRAMDRRLLSLLTMCRSWWRLPAIPLLRVIYNLQSIYMNMSVVVLSDSEHGAQRLQQHRSWSNKHMQHAVWPDTQQTPHILFSCELPQSSKPRPEHTHCRSLAC